MLQRIQTVWLLLALACLIAFIALPFGTLTIPDGGVEAVGQLFAYDFIGLIVPAALAVILSLIAIFAYSNLGFQKSCVLLSIAMTLVSIGITVYILCDRATEGTISWTWCGAFTLGALLFEILALTGINHDIKLLRSYDRLR